MTDNTPNRGETGTVKDADYKQIRTCTVNRGKARAVPSLAVFVAINTDTGLNLDVTVFCPLLKVDPDLDHLVVWPKGGNDNGNHHGSKNSFADVFRRLCKNYKRHVL